jgi:inner membrane protein
MDPLTHTLAGATLSSTRLGRKSRFATAALVIGANLPDVDGICYLLDGDLALGFRRGWTHGVLAIGALPVLLAYALTVLDRVWRRGEVRADFRWLLGLSAIAVGSHPLLDWLNTYGLRWLMPFDGRWFYGDAVFIMDVWLWLALGVGFLAGARPRWSVVGPGLMLGAWIAWTVSQRSPEHLPLLLGVAAALGGALAWRRPAEDLGVREQFAAAGLLLAALYIGGRVALNEITEAAVENELHRRGLRASALMAGPHPVNPLRWSIVARTDPVYRYGDFHWGSRTLSLEPTEVKVAVDSPEWRRARAHPSVQGLVTWLRFPAYEVERGGDLTRVHIFDARRRGGGRRATVELTPED